ncbi:MAG: electron transfer flavoprotein subunit beta/FixA family protein [Desulfamplus sp.]|nr:electron transfer flavoprotein subunit beta/FixA family protein [Desulfamplus sp.]
MRLNIIVCVKSVVNNMMPGSNRSSSGNMELNPFDRPAIEMALSLTKENQGSLTVLSMGPQTATFGLYQAIAMGADRGVLICDSALKESDTYVTAKVLGTALLKLQPFDLVLFGTRSSDSDTGHVGPQTAQMLGIPFIGNIHSLAVVRDKLLALHADNPSTEAADQSDSRQAVAENMQTTNIWSVERKADGYVESFEVKGRAAFTVSSSFTVSGETGFTSLHGIETAFSEKTIEFWDNSTLGLKAEETGLIASPTKIVAWNREKRSKKCLFIDGSPEQKAQQLAQKLSEAGFVG